MDQQLGSRYLLHELVGRGAMGQVFAGSVRESGAPVAIKVLKPELVSDPEVVARFFQERSILTSINHPNVVRVIDLVAEGDTLGIVMELVDGQDLRRHLRERRTLPPAEAVRLTRQVLQGVAAVHTLGIIHRDIKPENLLVEISSGQPHLKLTDFGVARLSYGASLTKMTSLIGTPEYMAPELADHDRATPATDLYSTGIVLYEMLTGRTPFTGGHPLAVLRRQVEQQPPPIPGLPAQLWAQLQSLLSKDPASRPRSAAQAADNLAPLEASLAGSPTLLPLAERRPQIWTSPRAAASPDVTVKAPDGRDEQRTVLRRRDRGEDARENTEAAAGRPTPTRPRRSAYRSRLVILALPVAVVVLAVAIGVVRLHPRKAALRAAHPASEASYSFAPQQYRDGLLIRRHWVLGGKDGSVMTETITASSITGKATRMAFEEPIPALIAPTLQTVRFAPTPAKIVRADPIVEWVLLLPAHGSVTATYQAHVSPAGVTQLRLLSWARAFTKMESKLAAGAYGRLKSPPGVPIALPTSVPGPIASSSTPAQVPRTRTSAPSSTSIPATPTPTPTAVAIPIGQACVWAYPGQASGSWSGSGYSIVCLDTNGQSLGGFPDGSGHSLNDWCADPSRTDGDPNLIQALLEPNGGWVCTTLQ